MKLIFLYGSPAVGKLTVSEEIAKQSDLRIFHNHLTFDAVAPIFEIGTETFWRLVDFFRFEVLKEAAKEKVDLVFTFCYAKKADDEFVSRVINAIEENGGEICFVLLTAEKDVIRKRVREGSRLKFKKATSVKRLNEIWKDNDFFSPIPERKSLIIDNTNVSAKKTARKIIEHFHLQPKKS